MPPILLSFCLFNKEYKEFAVTLPSISHWIRLLFWLSLYWAQLDGSWRGCSSSTFFWEMQYYNTKSLVFDYSVIICWQKYFAAIFLKGIHLSKQKNILILLLFFLLLVGFCWMTGNTPLLDLFNFICPFRPYKNVYIWRKAWHMFFIHVFWSRSECNGHVMEKKRRYALGSQVCSLFYISIYRICFRGTQAINLNKDFGINIRLFISSSGWKDGKKEIPMFKS